jgi:hypothetical protein
LRRPMTASCCSAESAFTGRAGAHTSARRRSSRRVRQGQLEAVATEWTRGVGVPRLAVPSMNRAGRGCRSSGSPRSRRRRQRWSASSSSLSARNTVRRFARCEEQISRRARARSPHPRWAGRCDSAGIGRPVRRRS